ncbi:malate synthase G [Thalassotalea fusca]
MQDRISIGKVQVAQPLYEFIEKQVLPDLPIEPVNFWQGFANIIESLTPINDTLLAKRQNLQQAIDDWHNNNSYDPKQNDEYVAFLQRIGYLAPPAPDFSISTQDVDPEIAQLAGPQLVVPITNARFVLNAVNARWGSLYDALYGSDAIDESGGAERGTQYNPVRGERVIAFGRAFLDSYLPLRNISHNAVAKYFVDGQTLCVLQDDGSMEKLQDHSQFIGYTGSPSTPSSLLFKHHGLHIELKIDATSNIGRNDRASVSDIELESALTTIMDCEDSVATVDTEDKILAYQNWLGLNKGTLSANLTKHGRVIERRMANDRIYCAPDGSAITVKGRSLMFVRNVGHLMKNDMVIFENGDHVYEGIVDAIVTSLIAMHDLVNQPGCGNSHTNSIYIVKPKMHGPEEVTFANTLFSHVEDLLQLPRNTIKMGIMDEERRTSVNLKACIYQARERVAFINTGFLDRTGDEIHTSMNAGPVERKADIKNTQWISAYEENNVAVGLACGLAGRAQIGKGMWAIPDNMADMLEQKVAHVLSGATTAWVPSPTAATLHAIHYHQINVSSVQLSIPKPAPSLLNDMLAIPLAEDVSWSAEEVTQEIDNNVQGILGYVVRWINQGIGCSKVPDINNIGLMEDRATLRISSQHLANWLLHGICTREQVEASLVRMAGIVDEQNRGDPQYLAITNELESSLAFQAASALIFNGIEQPSGYTEPLLHHYRSLQKLK